MKVLVSGVHLELTDRLKAYVEEHLATAITHFYDDEAAELDVHLVDNNGPKGGQDRECRVTAFLPGMATLHINETTDDIYKSIDFARDRLERIVKREVEKRRQPSGHPISRLARAEGVLAEEHSDELIPEEGPTLHE